jgi:hypothetical protein
MSSAVSDVQKIVVTLSEPDVVIEPGNVARLQVTMVNRQETPDRLLLEVEGIDIEWYNIPVAAVNVAPGAQIEERINFKVARSSENRAGSYPFVVRVQAMETGEVGFAQAMLVVKPFDSLQVELSPKRAVATFFRPLNDFDVTVANLGNAEETLELHANDPDDECAYEFDLDRIRLKPGQAETVPLAARPKSAAWIGGSRLYGFSVSARSVDDAYISAKTQGQIEKHALISPMLGIFLLLLGFGSGAYLFFRPVPPNPVRLTDFSATPPTVTAGDKVTLTWNVQGDRPTFTLKHRIGKDGVDVYDDPPKQPTGNISAPIEVTDKSETIYYTLAVTGPVNGPVEKTVAVTVIPAPVPPPPVIHKFNAEPSVVHVGEPVTLTWEASGQSKFVLDPGDLQFSQIVQSQIVTPNPQTPDQKMVYTLRAFGDDKRAKSAEKSVTVQVVSPDTCVAAISGFKAIPPQVYIGDKVRLRWSVVRARNIHIETDKGEQVAPGLQSSGSIEVPVTTKTTFILTAADNLGKTISRSLTVNATERPAPPPPTTTVQPGQTPDSNGATPPQDGATPPPPGPIKN